MSVKKVTTNAGGQERPLPSLFYIKLIRHYEHQGAKKTQERIVTTHSPSIMPKWFKDRGFDFARAKRKVA